jgi:hypothetical protein
MYAFLIVSSITIATLISKAIYSRFNWQGARESASQSIRNICKRRGIKCSPTDTIPTMIQHVNINSAMRLVSMILINIGVDSMFINMEYYHITKLVERIAALTPGKLADLSYHMELYQSKSLANKKAAHLYTLDTIAPDAAESKTPTADKQLAEERKQAMAEVIPPDIDDDDTPTSALPSSSSPSSSSPSSSIPTEAVNMTSSIIEDKDAPIMPAVIDDVEIMDIYNEIMRLIYKYNSGYKTPVDLIDVIRSMRENHHC